MRILKRTHLLRRHIGAAVIGFSLLWVDQNWLALGFCVLLWQFARDVKRYPGRYTSRLYDLLWETRFCWFFQIVMVSLTSGQEPVTTREVAIAGLVTAAALWHQNLPRLSLNFCFIDGKRTPQVSFERLLWMNRVERLYLAALLAWQPTSQTLLNLALFSGTRLLLGAVQSVCLNSPEWSGCLRSEQGPWRDHDRRVFPDLRSYWDHQPKELPFQHPRDGFDGSPLVETYPELVETPDSFSPGSEETPEYRLALLILAVSIFTAYLPTISSSGFASQQTFKTRLVSQEGRPRLYQANLSPGEEALLESVSLPRTKVSLLPEAHALFIVVGLALAFRSVRGLGLVWLGCLMGWFWFPTSVATMALLTIVLQDKQTRLKQLFTLFKSVSNSFRRAITIEPAAPMEDPERKGVPGLPIPELEFGLGKGVLRLVDPNKGAPLLPAIKKWRRDVLNTVGFFPGHIRLRDDRNLLPSTIEVRLKGVPLGNIVVEGEYVQLGTEEQMRTVRGIKSRERLTNLPAVWIGAAKDGNPEFQMLSGSQWAIRDLNYLLKGYLQEFITTSRTQQILNQATAHHNELVKQVCSKHSIRTLKKVLKEVVAAGHSLVERKVWLNALLQAEGSDELVISQVLTTLSSSVKGEATKSQ